MTGRPPARFDSTTRAGWPPTMRAAPSANRSGSSLASSTTNAPSSPCGLPTRPTWTRSATERGECLFGRRNLEDVLGGQLLRERMAGSADLGGCALEVVLRVAELDVVVEDGPVGARPRLVGHADTAGVDDPDRAAHPVHLHVHVADHQARLRDALE